MAGWEGLSLSGKAHCGSVWVAVNGSPATITIETCEDPGDWTTAIAGTGPARQAGSWWVAVWGRRRMQGSPGRGAGGLEGLLEEAPVWSSEHCLQGLGP